VKPGRLRKWQDDLISKIFEITFGMRLIEKGEAKAQSACKKILHDL
jgi:hypothetical protein